MDEVKHTHFGWRDRLGITLSVLCMFHCLLTPLVLMGVPFLSHQAYEFLASNAWHQVFLLLVPMVALIAFLPGWKRHRDGRVWWLSGWGLLFLMAGVAIGFFAGDHSHVEVSPGQFWLAMTTAELHDLPAFFEIALSLIGGGLFIRAHWLNRELAGCGTANGAGRCEHSGSANDNKQSLELAHKMG